MRGGHNLLLSLAFFPLRKGQGRCIPIVNLSLDWEGCQDNLEVLNKKYKKSLKFQE